MSDEDIDPRLFESVILVDRAAQGGCGFKYNGRDFAFAPGQVELPINRLTADFITGPSEQALVETVDGDSVHRFAIKGTLEADQLIELAAPPVPDPIVTRSAAAMRRAQREHQGGRASVMAERGPS